MTRSTPSCGRPALHVVLPLEGSAHVYTEASCEADYLRLVLYLERSPALRPLLEALDELEEAA